MFTFTRARILVIALAIFATLGVSLLVFNQNVIAQPSIWQGSFDGWSYAGYVDSDGYVNARVRLEANTVSGLKKYAVANRLLASQLWKAGQQTMQMEVTFKRPISIETLSRLQTRSGVIINRVQARVISADGQRVGMDWVVAKQSDLNPPSMDLTLNDISQKMNGSAQFLGVVSFIGGGNRQTYDQLISDPDVFIADVTANQIRSDVGNNIPIEKFSMVTGPAVFWLMEDAGLDNFQ
jgi:hypothetical protein